MAGAVARAGAAAEDEAAWLMFEGLVDSTDDGWRLLRCMDDAVLDTAEMTEGDRWCVDCGARRAWVLALWLPMLDETLMMSFPCTTTSFDPDFFNSVVNISNKRSW